MKFAAHARAHLTKARDSALLAIEFYNKPAVSFKTAGYITMMHIACTSLFHAIFFKARKRPFYKNQSGHFELIDGEFRYWELGTCIREYFGNENNAVRANLEFFIPFRNKIEHKSMPQIDGTVFAECQSLLLNFDALVEKEFGVWYVLRESLSFSLQLFPRATGFDLSKPKPSEKDVVEFITNYRSALSPEIYTDSRYAFKAFLVKVGNHQASDALPLKVVDFDSLTEDQRRELPALSLLVKPKEVAVNRMGLMKPGEIVKRVQAGIGNLKVRKEHPTNPQKFTIEDRFNLSLHTCLWKKHQVRPKNGAPNPAKTRPEYCVYNDLNKNYGFTPKWVEFLIGQVKDDAIYLSLFHSTAKLQLLPSS
jgi:hypothetical protein